MVFSRNYLAQTQKPLPSWHSLQTLAGYSNCWRHGVEKNIFLNPTWLLSCRSFLYSPVLYHPPSSRRDPQYNRCRTFLSRSWTSLSGLLWISYMPVSVDLVSSVSLHRLDLSGRAPVSWLSVEHFPRLLCLWWGGSTILGWHTQDVPLPKLWIVVWMLLDPDEQIIF